MKSDTRTRVTFFLPTLEGGGAERNTINFIKTLSPDAYAIRLVLAKKNGVFLKEVPVFVDIYELKTTSLLIIFFKLARYFNRGVTDIFISSFPRFNAVSLLARKFSLKPVKIIIIEHKAFSLFATTSKLLTHRFIAKFIFPYFIGLFYPEADSIICVSKGVEEDLLKYLPDSDKIKVIYNPVAEEKIYQLSLRPLIHPWLENEKTPLILSVGRLIAAKDYPTLLRAFVLVLKKHPLARLIVLGEGDERHALEQLSRQLHINEYVQFRGFEENPYAYMKRASVFVMSSQHEGFGNVIVEAMACGAPVVSTDCKSGPAEIIEQGKSGLLVPVKDENALAAAILKILDNPVLAHTLSEGGKERARHFSVEKSTREYEQIFTTLYKKS